MTGLYYPSPAALAKRNQLRDAVGKGELARLARTGRRPADQPGRQFPTPFSYASRAAEALGGDAEGGDRDGPSSAVLRRVDRAPVLNRIVPA